MTSRANSLARPVFLIVLIVIALVLRAQVNSPSASGSDTTGSPQSDLPLQSFAKDARQNQLWTNHFGNSRSGAQAINPQKSKDIR